MKYSFHSITPKIKFFNKPYDLFCVHQLTFIFMLVFSQTQQYRLFIQLSNFISINYCMKGDFMIHNFVQNRDKCIMSIFDAIE